MPKYSDIDALVRDLTDFQEEAQVEELIEEVLAEPLPTEVGSGQVEPALETFEVPGSFGRDDAQGLHLLMTIGRTYERLSHPEEAYETYEKALALAERLEDARARATLLNRMSRVLSGWDRWEEALYHLDRSREAYRALGDEQGQARVVANRGIIFHEQGDYEAATEAYEEALELAQRAGDQKTLVDASNNLAVLATIRGDLDDAVTRYQTCLEMYQEIGNGLELAQTYHNLGMPHVNRRNWNVAAETGKEVKAA